METMTFDDPMGETTLEGCDAYFAEYSERAEAGKPNPLDLANAALERALQAGDVLSEDHDSDAIRTRIEAALQAARLTAQAMGQDREDLAIYFARECEREAARLDAFDTARFEGLSRPVAFRDGRAGRQARQGDLTGGN
jgi:hypothetical protein